MLTPDQFNVSQKHYQNVMLGLVAMEQLRMILRPATASPDQKAEKATDAQAHTASKDEDSAGNPSGDIQTAAKNKQSADPASHAIVPGPTAQKDGASNPTAEHSGKGGASKPAKTGTKPQSKTPPVTETPSTQSSDVGAVSDGIVQIVNHIILDNLYIDTCDWAIAPRQTAQGSQSAISDSGSSWLKEREKLCADLLHQLLTGPKSSKKGHYEEVQDDQL